MVATASAPAVEKFSRVDVLLILISIVWGINFTFVKGALVDFSPLSFNAIRFAASSLILLSLLWLRERSFRIKRRDVGLFVLLGLVGNTAYQLFFIHGIVFTTATNSSLIIATTPIFIVLFSVVLRVEKVTSPIAQGVILSFAGITMIVLGSGKTFNFTDQSWIGDLLTIANPVCWGAYTVLSKPLLKDYSPLKLTAITMAIGAVPLVVVSAPALSAENWAAISTNSWLSLAFSAVFAIAIGYIVWYTGVDRIGTSRTALYENLVTVFAVASAWGLLSETMTAIQIAGAALVFVSLYVARRNNNKPRDNGKNL